MGDRLPKYILHAWLLECRVLGHCPFDLCTEPDIYEQLTELSQVPWYCLHDYRSGFTHKCQILARKRYGRSR